MALLPTSFNHLVTTLMYGNETLELKEMVGVILPCMKVKKDGDDSQVDGHVSKTKLDNGNRSMSKQRKSNRKRSQSRLHLKEDVECYYCQKDK